MLKKIVRQLSVTICLICFFTFGYAQIYIGDTEVDTATIITGLDIPWEIQWGPDGYIWTTERYGRVSRIHPETGEQNVILDISDQVYQSGESGLLGMALSPNFQDNQHVFMAYTYQTGGDILEKIVRYSYTDGELVNEEILMDDIPGNTTHDGCRMIFLEDNTLLFSTGDAQNQQAAQYLLSKNGKFHRINPDGTIPEDNPFTDSPVYSYGHRNAQGLFLGPNGIIYSSEHGPSTDDELNIIEPGRNYGWPNVHGFCDLPAEEIFCEENDVAEPLVAWTPTIATSDIVYYDHDAIPEWKDHILLTALKNKRLYDLELNEEGTSVINEAQFFNNWWGRLRDILIGPQGEIYLATNGSSWVNTEPFTHSIVKVWNPDYVNINEYSDELDINVFPNPAIGIIKLSVDQKLVGSICQIIALDSSVYYEQIIENKYTEVVSEHFPNGVYVCRIIDDNQLLISRKIIILNN